MNPRHRFARVITTMCGLTAVLASHASATPPSTYNAISSTAVIAKPSVTDSGLFDLNLSHCPTHTAGYIFTPTDFYCPILRVTDPNTDTTLVGASFLGPGSWMQQAWNCTSTYFYIRGSNSHFYVYSFVASTMTATKLSGYYDGLTSWDSNHPAKCWGVSGTNLVYWDFTNPASPVMNQSVNVASFITGITEVYESHPSDGTGDGGTNSLKLMAVTGGNGAQGTDYEVLWIDPVTQTGSIYNTLAGTITDTSGHVLVSGLPTTYYIHQGSITRDGRYVWIQIQGNPVTGTGQGPFIWDTTANTVTALGSLGLLSRPGGHFGLGWVESINSDYVSATPTAKWWYRKVDTLTDMQTPVSLVANVPSTQSTCDDHQCWNTAQNGGTSTNWFPIFLSTIQSQGTYSQNPNYWADEIIGIATTDRSGAGTNTVWRFAHHRSTILAHPTQDDYNSQAWPNVSQDGKWVLFQSNWEETLGIRTGSNYFRTDVFIVKLTQSSH